MLHLKSHPNRYSIFLLAILTIIFLYPILLHPIQLLYPAKDITGQYLPWKSIITQTIRKEKTIPFWDNYEFSGIPLAANPLTAIFYPSIVLYLLLPLPLAFNLNILLDVFLIGAFTYLFAKQIIRNTTSALLSAIIMMFSGQITARIYAGHLANLDVIVWLPLLFYFTEKLLQSKKNIYTILISLTVALMILAGQLQFTYFALIANTIYFICQLYVIARPRSDSEVDAAIPSGLELTKLFLKYLAALILALALAAIQLSLTLELNTHSLRAAGVSYDFASTFSLPIPQTISFLFPHAFGSPIINDWWGRGNPDEFTAYVGILPIMLTLFALLKTNKYTKTFLIILLISLWISFGSYVPFFHLIYEYIPGFKSLRIPATFLYIYTFALAILAGLGVNALTNVIARPRSDSEVDAAIPSNAKTNFLNLKSSITITLIFLILSLFTTIFIALNQTSIIHYLQFHYKFHIQNYTTAYQIIRSDSINLSFQLLAILIALIIFSKRKIKTSLTLFFTITIISLLQFSIPLISTQNPNQPNSSDLITYLKKTTPHGRILDLSINNTPTIKNNFLETVTGYNPYQLNYYRDYIWQVGDHLPLPYEPVLLLKNIKNTNLLKLLHTQTIIAPHPLATSGLKFLKKINTNYLYTIPDTLPQAFIIPNATVVQTNTQALQKVQSKNWNIKQEIVLEEKPSVNLKNPGTYTPITQIKKQTNQITIETNRNHPGFLILSEVWYPGWQATINGKTTPIYRANGILRAIYLPSGKNHITFSYEPTYFKFGLLISLTALMVCIIYIILNSILRAQR